MILCLGDSLTFGRVGYSYIKYMKPNLTVINKGINGETTVGALNRLSKYISNPRYDNVDTYIVSIGANDILLPYLSSLSTVWKIQMKPRIALKKCITNDNEFAEKYEEIIKLTKTKKTILVGLPFIQLAGFPTDILLRRNQIINKLSHKYGVPFIDTYSLQHAALTQVSKSYSWGVTNLIRMIDAFFMLIFPYSKDWLAKRRGLELTVDGVHFSSVSAKLIAKKIEEHIFQV